MKPKTLTDAIRYYSDPQTCIDAVAALRWPDGKPACPNCHTAEGDRKHYWLAAQKRWKCYQCRKQFSVKVGSIFEDSALGLDVWMIALWMLCNCKIGVSSYEIGRATGITQKSAWFVLQRLRLVLRDVRPAQIGNGSDNPVEIDETYIGPKPKNMHKNKLPQLARKTVVMGMLARGTREVRAKVIPNAKREVLQKEILARVGFGSTIYTDQHTGYMDLARQQFIHDTVNHAEEYVRGEVHTNSIENFWSLLKRNLAGTYVAVEPFHLDRYLAEQVFRFNNRKGMNDEKRFAKVLSQVAGKRLTYAQVTGKVGETAF